MIDKGNIYQKRYIPGGRNSSHVEEKVPEISEEKMVELTREYEEFIQKREKFDQEKYGHVQTTNELKKDFFEGFVKKIGHCKVERILVEKESRKNQVIFFKKEKEEDNDGSNAILSLNAMIRGNLVNPYVERIYRSLFSTKYKVEYRENNKKRYVKLTFEKGTTKSKFLEILFIRET